MARAACLGTTKKGARCASTIGVFEGRCWQCRRRFVTAPVDEVGTAPAWPELAAYLAGGDEPDHQDDKPGHGDQGDQDEERGGEGTQDVAADHAAHSSETPADVADVSPPDPDALTCDGSVHVPGCDHFAAAGETAGRSPARFTPGHCSVHPGQELLPLFAATNWRGEQGPLIRCPSTDHDYSNRGRLPPIGSGTNGGPLRCAWCGDALEPRSRYGTVFGSSTCRVASWRANVRHELGKVPRARSGGVKRLRVDVAAFHPAERP